MIYAGDQNVRRCFLGDTFIKKIYQGDTLVFEHKSRLPKGYTELAYISNPDGAYICDFGISATGIWSNRLEFGLKLLDESKSQGLFGGRYTYYYKRTSGTTSRSCINTLSYVHSDEGNSVCFNYGYHSTSNTGFTPISIPYTNPEMKIIVDIPKQLFSVNGESAELPSGRTTSNARTPSLFAINRYSYYYYATVSTNSPVTTTNYGSDPANMRLYYLKVYSSTADETGELVHNYVPAKTSAGEVGIFDLVTEKFYKHYTGSPAFAAGPKA